MTWLVYALISAGAAALTAVLAKLGVDNVPSSLATAIRTSVVVVAAWAIALSRSEHVGLFSVPRRAYLFLALSGLATAISWLAYFRALQLGPVSSVAPIDKLSLPLTIVLAFVWLGEPLGWRTALGVTLMTVGALITIR